MSNPSGGVRDQQVNYTPTQGNDKGYELVELCLTWWRANKFNITSTERTNVATAISNLMHT